MLFDPVTGQITGVLDFDFSYVGHPADEFLAYSFSDMGCSLGQASPALRHAILSGDFTFHGAGAESIKSNTTAGGKESQDDADTFAVASAFFTALADKGGYVPSNIAGMETLEALRDVEAMLAPFALSMLVMIERARAKGVDLDAKRAEAEEKLVEWLEGMGY